MSERFADAARTLARMACGPFGWRPDEFWNATPADLVLAAEGLAAPAPASLSGAELTRLMERERNG